MRDWVNSLSAPVPVGVGPDFGVFVKRRDGIVTVGEASADGVEVGTWGKVRMSDFEGPPTPVLEDTFTHSFPRPISCAKIGRTRATTFTRTARTSSSARVGLEDGEGEDEGEGKGALAIEERERTTGEGWEEEEESLDGSWDEERGRGRD